LFFAFGELVNHFVVSSVLCSPKERKKGSALKSGYFFVLTQKSNQKKSRLQIILGLLHSGLLAQYNSLSRSAGSLKQYCLLKAFRSKPPFSHFFPKFSEAGVNPFSIFFPKKIWWHYSPSGDLGDILFISLNQKTVPPFRKGGVSRLCAFASASAE
jgi:hypothetical protein